MAKLKAASSLNDVAVLLSMKPSALAYLVYGIPDTSKYVEFEIPKSGGGARKILAPTPKLKLVQRRVADLLQRCRAELDQATPRTALSHGFRKGRSIVTNARKHRNRRYVLNIDLEDFFPSINFGRVRGFFLKDNCFLLHERTATVLAQIACFQNTLPQGSPCSPIISDLIGHLLDVKLVKLAKKNNCTYSRYADDITFSTNQKSFPNSLAVKLLDIWTPSVYLENAILSAGFKINAKKTRMFYDTNRQLVTGLIVNKKINVRREYLQQTRSMCHSLFSDGYFHRRNSSPIVGPLLPSRLLELQGVLSHIFSIKDGQDRRDSAEKKKNPSAIRKTYSKFLFFKFFVNLHRPLIICEGVTDPIYIKSAIKYRTSFQPKLGEIKDGRLKTNIDFFNGGRRTCEILQLGGGTGEMAFFISDFAKCQARYRFRPLLYPVILLIDNDSGSKGVFNTIKQVSGITIDIKSNSDFYHIKNNLYLVKTPEIGPSGESAIEHFFDTSTLKTQIDGKTFNPGKNIDPSTEYGKVVFARQVVHPNAAKIDLSGFDALLKRIDAVLGHYVPP